MNYRNGAMVVVALALVLAGCQTTKTALVAPAQSAIEVEKSGFSPAGAAGQNNIEISLLFGNGDSVSSWKVEVASGGTAQKTWIGDSSALPSSLTWDGKADSGSPAPEGTYTARLTVDYKEKFQEAAAESRSFVLDVSPPTGTVTVDTSSFTPTEKGAAGSLTMKIDASSKTAKMATWSLDVLSPSGSLVRNWSGQWPTTSVSWDGTSLDGGFVTPATTYQAVATVRDEYGNSAQLRSDVTVAALPVTAPAVAAQQPVPPKPSQPQIMATLSGFSPNADGVADTMTLKLGFDQPTAVTAWQVAIAQASGTVQKTWAGNGSNLPTTLSWDGKSNNGALAPEGTYVATLSVTYGSALAPGRASSTPFVLDVTPPTGSIALSTPLFSPIESSDTISLSIDARSPLAKIDSWTMDIYDPGGNVFRSFAAKWPNATAIWNGRNPGGELVQSAEDYPVVVKVRDQFGNTGTIKTVVPIDVLVEKLGTGYRILASRIFFKAFTADYRQVAPDLAAQNLKRLDTLAEKLKKFPGYKVRLVGHAVSIYWDSPQKSAIEQRDVLLPLSKARAEAVLSAMIERGLDASRFTAEGVGASDQLVPDSNYKDRWMNRRVALFIEK